MALTFELVRQCLNNAEDAGERWQIEGGQVFQGRTRKHVANYSSVKRVSCGTHEQNTAQLWVTIFFLGKKPPENPADPDVAIWEAVAWAAVSGTAVGLARQLAQRRAASYYARSTGHLPPDLRKDDQEA